MSGDFLGFTTLLLHHLTFAEKMVRIENVGCIVEQVRKPTLKRYKSLHRPIAISATNRGVIKSRGNREFWCPTQTLFAYSN